MVAIETEYYHILQVDEWNILQASDNSLAGCALNISSYPKCF